METTLFIVTKDEFGNDRMWSGCKDFVAQWTLQVEKAWTTSDFKFALDMSRQYADSRIVRGFVDYGPIVRHNKKSQTFIILGVAR